MAGVCFENVTKRFGNTIAVNNLNLEIPDKEFLVLVGPSGCGKSTVLRLLSGLEDVTEGTIYIGGQPVNNIPPRDRNIAMVFQSYALYPHMSVYDNMAFGLSLRHIPKLEIDQRVKEAARILNIEDLLKRKPRQLSGGQRQRVALGRAIVRQPVAFLLDEPLSNLDAKLRVQTRAELNKLHQRLGTTFIYVTHDQTEAMTMANRIAVLDKGILQQVGTPHDLYDKPDNIFVAGFIGSPAMNFFETVIVRKEDVTYLAAETFQVPVTGSKSSQAANYMGETVTLGIRPEDLYIKEYLPYGIPYNAAVKVKVEVIEMMGNELLLYVVTGRNHFLARVDPRTEVKPGEDIEILFNMNNMYIFDPATGKAIRA
jgi:multiple sugar transport system ATP-binding protein